MGLKLREIGFQRTYIFKIFRGSMPPDPPRKVRLRRTITFSITYEHPLENLSYAPVEYSNLCKLVYRATLQVWILGVHYMLPHMKLNILLITQCSYRAEFSSSR